VTVLWKMIATVAYILWVINLPTWEWGTPYPSERMVVILLYVLVMMRRD